MDLYVEVNVFKLDAGAGKHPEAFQALGFLPSASV
jgi:hypothetical protein